MATAQFAPRVMAPNMIKSDLDMDSLFDFNQDNHSAFSQHPHAGSSKTAADSQSYINDDDSSHFAGPSHEYDLFPQQTGVVVGQVRDLSNLNQPMPDRFSTFGGFNSGFDEGSFDMAWDMDTGMNDPQLFGDKFVDPSYIDAIEEPRSNVGRLWPGMHQQAAMQKAQQQAFQPTPAQQLPRQVTQHVGKGKARASSQPDVDAEESISRLLNRMRQESALSSIAEDDTASQNGFMSSMSKMKREEEDMDEDERLLASEEGKKLSSKERRQLRNKVSARAFRSRRKEYIGQLEGEVATKAQEVSILKHTNQALVEENERYRALIQTLLRHPSFVPFIDDFSRDPAFLASQSQRRPNANSQSQNTKHNAPRQLSDANLDMSMLNIDQQSVSAPRNGTFDFAQAPGFNNDGFDSRNPSRHGTYC